MNLVKENLFERLLRRYERRFGGPPPITVATLDEAIAYVREKLNGPRSGWADGRERATN